MKKFFVFFLIALASTSALYLLAPKAICSSCNDIGKKCYYDSDCDWGCYCARKPFNDGACVEK